MMYVPILETLRVLLENEAVLTEVCCSYNGACMSINIVFMLDYNIHRHMLGCNNNNLL